MISIGLFFFLLKRKKSNGLDIYILIVIGVRWTWIF